MEHKQRSNPGPKPRSPHRRRRRRRRSASAGAESQRATSNRPAAAGAAAAEAAAAPQPVLAPADSAPAVGADAGDAGEPGAASVPALVPASAVAAAAGGGEFVCPVCSRTVHDLYTAIAYGAGMAPAHFDCVLTELGAREQFGAGERLCYIGSGSFGIVSMNPARGKRNGNGGGLFIRKRIEFEDRGAAPEWRQELWLTARPRLPPAVAEPEAAPCR